MCITPVFNSFIWILENRFFCFVFVRILQNENEIIPFPNDEAEFCLPEFGSASNNVSGDSESSVKLASSSFSSTKSETVQQQTKTKSATNRSNSSSLNQPSTTTTTSTTAKTNTKKSR